MKFISVSALSLVVLSTLVAAHKPTVYLIRHGEKPSDGGTGLDADGEKRARCLRKVFGASSEYKIGYIMAQAFKSGKLSGVSIAFFFLPSSLTTMND